MQTNIDKKLRNIYNMEAFYDLLFWEESNDAAGYRLFVQPVRDL
jgi:hypothetical protein